MAAERKESKSKAAKVKLSKPNPKQKQPQYRIEITPAMIKILRVDSKGKIIGNGIARMEGDPIWSDKAWIDRFSQKIRAAARNAKVPKGTNILCSVVAHGPQIIVQRFTWPEFNHKAMIENAKFEIASYLPGAASNYIINAEIQKRNPPADEKAASIDVFVAAMPTDMALAISTALTWAGFKIINLDVSENVRGRLISQCCVAGGSTPTSYGVLDLCSAVPNVTLYLDGHFYSTQYFSAMQQGFSPPSTIDEMEAAAGSSQPSEGHNVESILREISFVSDFIKYQERANIEAILVMGKCTPDFTDRLSMGLDIPVYATEAWLRSGVAGTVKSDAGPYLDAYASGLPSMVIGYQHMLNLKTPPIIRNPRARITALVAGMLAVIFFCLGVAMFVPFMFEQALRGELEDLKVEEQRVQDIVDRAPTAEAVEIKRQELVFLQTRINGVDNFYGEFAQAAVIVPALFNTEFVSIRRIEAANQTVAVSATAINYRDVADLLEYLREHPLFREVMGARIGGVEDMDTKAWEDGTADINLTLTMERKAGAIEYEQPERD